MTDVLLPPAIRLPKSQAEVFGNQEEVIAEPQPAEDIKIDWPGLKRGVKAMRERLSIARAEARALGHLATLNLEAAGADLAYLPSQAAEPKIKPMGFWERARLQRDNILEQQYASRYRRRQELKRNLGQAAALGASALLAAYIISRY
jgi:hypothetical protein